VTPTEADHLALIETESRRLVAIALKSDGEAVVPSCPDWTLRELVGHVGGANRWMATCVTGGLKPQERMLPAPPDDADKLVAWFEDSVAELLKALAAIPSQQLVWTPVTGAQGSAWWRRKAAVEVGIHRWDADNATSKAPQPLAANLALEGIAEFVEEFLPLMLLAAPVAPVPSIRLCPNDIDAHIDVSLLPAGDTRATGSPGVQLTGSASDLLLWIWNRVSADRVGLPNDEVIAGWWKGLAI
jgi:uncharacterized protein (TIGR03083 family)